MKLFKTIYNKSDEKILVAESEVLDKLARIIDKEREKADKTDKIKFETFDNDKLIGKLFVSNNNYSDDLFLINKVGELLEQAGMSKLELSRRIGMNYKNLRNLIDREYLDSTSLINAIKIADALNVHVDDLYEFEEMIEPKLPDEEKIEKLKEMLTK